VNLLVAPGGLTLLEAHLMHAETQLGVNVAPLLDPAPGQEVALAKLAELAFGQMIALLFQKLPEVLESQEVRVLVKEGGMDLVCHLLLIHRPLPRILDAERRGDDQHLGQAVLIHRSQQHARDTRVHGETGKLLPELGQVAGAVQGRQLLKGPITVRDQPGVRRVDEGKIFDRSEPEQLHLQDDRGQVGALDLRLGVLGPRLEVVL
jgi:hypothetical protein